MAKKNRDKIRFRASSCHVLNTIPKGAGITEKQLEMLSDYEFRDLNAGQVIEGKKVRALTSNQKIALEELRAKRDTPVGLSDTAKTMIEQMYLFDVYGFKKQFSTDTTLKGHLTEQKAIALIQSIWYEEGFRSKNKDSYTRDFFAWHSRYIAERY